MADYPGLKFSQREFVRAMARFVPDDARLMFCQFRGDPYADVKGKWVAHVLSPHTRVDVRSNVYMCVSAMRRNAKGEFRRRKENFAGGLLLMIDDLGDGPGAKFPLGLIEALAPTALVETSPDNFQAIYMFDRLVEDIKVFDALIRAFIEKAFLSDDPGMAGVNRVFRPPIGINGKPKYGGDFNVRLAKFEPSARYSVDDICRAFGLELVLHHGLPRDERMTDGHRAERMDAYFEVHEALSSAGMLKVDAPDAADWMEIRCPWVDNHTNAVDNGAAIRLPNEENAWYGGFRCHHGNCAGKGWRELTQWLAEEQAEILELINVAWERLPQPVEAGTG